MYPSFLSFFINWQFVILQHPWHDFNFFIFVLEKEKSISNIKYYMLIMFFYSSNSNLPSRQIMCREIHNGARTSKRAIGAVFHVLIFCFFNLLVTYILHSKSLAIKRITFSLKYLSHVMVKQCNGMIKGWLHCLTSESKGRFLAKNILLAWCLVMM